MAASGIAVIIPCYRVREQIIDVLGAIPEQVDRVYCIDDVCPEGSGDLIEERCNDPRVVVCRNSVNLGVGGTVIAGYRRAKDDGCSIAVKIDGDGQMDPRLLPQFVEPILIGRADYTKGNRFFSVERVRSMPRVRVFGNACLSFMAKLSSGYWNLFDPTNGYTALHLAVLDVLSLEKISNRYFSSPTFYSI